MSVGNFNPLQSDHLTKGSNFWDENSIKDENSNSLPCTFVFWVNKKTGWELRTLQEKVFLLTCNEFEGHRRVYMCLPCC